MLTKIQKSENRDGICFTKSILEAAQMNVGDEVLSILDACLY